MKQPIFKILIACIAACSLINCTTPPNNGLLDGQWQVMSIKDNLTDSIRPQELIYYAFGQSIVNIRWTNRHPEAGNMVFTEDSIHLEMPYSSMNTIHQFGMDSTLTNFSVELLNSTSLVMKGQKYTVSCRRF